MEGENCELICADGLVTEISIERVFETILKAREKVGRAKGRHTPASIPGGVGP